MDEEPTFIFRDIKASVASGPLGVKMHTLTGTVARLDGEVVATFQVGIGEEAGRLMFVVTNSTATSQVTPKRFGFGLWNRMKGHKQ